MKNKFPKITPELHAYVVANRLTMSASDMARHFEVPSNMLSKYMRANGLSVSPELVKQFKLAAIAKSNQGRTSSTPELDEIIKANYLSIPEKTLAKMLGKSSCFLRNRLKQLGLEVPKELAAERKKIGMFRQGQTAANKGKKQIDYMTPEAIERTKATRFQKGNKPTTLRIKTEQSPFVTSTHCAVAVASINTSECRLVFGFRITPICGKKYMDLFLKDIAFGSKMAIHSM